MFSELKEVQRLLKNKIEEEFKMEEKIFTNVTGDIEKQIKELGFFCDSDRVEGNISSLINSKVIDMEELDEDFEVDDMEILNSINEWLETNYKRVSEVRENGDYIGYWHPKNLSFKSIEELEDYFEIME